jgi:hypothetical protein
MMTGRLPRKYAAAIAIALGASLSTPQLALAQTKSGTTMAQGTQTIFNQLQARGAKITMATRAQVMQRAGSLANRSGGGVPACGDNACICTGSECLDVIDSNKCNEDTWHCVPSDDGPVCVCEQK